LVIYLQNVDIDRGVLGLGGPNELDITIDLEVLRVGAEKEAETGGVMLTLEGCGGN